VLIRAWGAVWLYSYCAGRHACPAWLTPCWPGPAVTRWPGRAGFVVAYASPRAPAR